jgi:predicted phage tail protein
MWIRAIIGTILLAVGGVWIAQGTGALGGSFMTGEGFWTFMGVVTALIGIALLIGIARTQRRMRDSD